MIIVSLFGGLGNQMFQYACGKAVAMKLGVELKLDIQYLTDRTPREGFTYRDYELIPFNIQEKIATIKETKQFTTNLWNSNKLERQFYKLKRTLYGNTIFIENIKFCYNKEIDFVTDNTYLYGYFQTEDYFVSIKNEIMNSFCLRNEMDVYNISLITKMKAENSVSIHIRRGDYENSIFELLNLEDYYLKAIEIINNNVESPVFYIFSNDIEWIEKKFTSININKTIVNVNHGKQSYLDMILMSNCKHNICANSSFSWWSAWLNKNMNKIVITPKKWFKNNRNNENQFHLIPNDWVKI